MDITEKIIRLLEKTTSDKPWLGPKEKNPYYRPIFAPGMKGQDNPDYDPNWNAGSKKCENCGKELTKDTGKFLVKGKSGLTGPICRDCAQRKNNANTKKG
jgi:hypothetical protein